MCIHAYIHACMHTYEFIYIDRQIDIIHIHINVNVCRYMYICRKNVNIDVNLIVYRYTYIYIGFFGNSFKYTDFGMYLNIYIYTCM